MQASVIKRPINAHNPLEQDAFDSLLLDEQLIETEEAHDIRHKYLFRSVSLILKNNALEELKQGVAMLTFNFASVEVYFFLKCNLLQKKLTEGFFKPRWQCVNFSYNLIVLQLPLIEISRATMLKLGINDELDEFLKLCLSLLEDKFQVLFAKSLPFHISIFF